MSGNHTPTSTDTDGISIRRLGGGDRADLERLAQLDSRAAPEGALLGLAVEGRLVAAISVATGESIADPFSRTRELRALLELRADQLLTPRERSTAALPPSVRLEGGHGQAGVLKLLPVVLGRLLRPRPYDRLATEWIWSATGSPRPR